MPLLRTWLWLWFIPLAMVVEGGTAKAQEDYDDALIAKIKQTPLNGQFGGGFLVGNPQGEYRDSLRNLGAPNVGYGFAFHGGYVMDRIPLGFVVDGGILFMGGDSKERILPRGLFRDTIQTTTQTSVIPVSLALRLQPNIETWVFPYAEVTGGFNVFVSRYSASHSQLGEISSDSRSDAGWTYGVGLGVGFKVADMITLPNELQRLVFDVRLRYISSGRTTVSTVSASDNSYEFKSAIVERSNLVTALVGFTFQF